MLIRELADLLFLLLLCVTIFTVWEVTSLSDSKDGIVKRKCSCEKCIIDHQDWFMQRFQKQIPPFLTQNYTLPQADFNWWRKFQRERGSLLHFKTNQEKLFEYFPARPAVVEADPRRCRRCAVVGNSGNLRRTHYGKLIDFHDIVFRINHGKTEGFEEDVGNRTTHRVMYPTSASDLDNSTHLVFFPFKIRDLEWLLKASTGQDPTELFPTVAIKRSVSANRTLVMVVNPAFMKYVHKYWLGGSGHYPSTGFMTVILALHMCDEVSVFGFGADNRGNWSHYWERLRSSYLRTGNHPGSIEYSVIEELGKRGKVMFYTGL